MKKEMTREIIEEVSCCDGDCDKCSALKLCCQGSNLMRRRLATALLEEMDKPKVWDGAPDITVRGIVNFYGSGGSYISHKTYTREIPKTRARIMAEEIAAAQISNKSDLIDIIEQTINTHMKELKGEE